MHLCLDRLCTKWLQSTHYSCSILFCTNDYSNSNEEPTNRRPAHRAKTSDGGLSGSILKKSSTGSTAARNGSDGGNGICWNYNVKSFKACEGDTHVEAEDFHVSVLDADFKPEEAGLDQSGTIEYYPMDESTNSRRLSAKWDDLIFKKRMMKGRKQKGCFAEEKNSPIEEEEGSPSNENDNPPKDIARRYSSFDSFGLSVDGSDRDENQHDQALTSRMRRALQAFASFGAESAIPEEEEVVAGIDTDATVQKKKNTTKKGKRGSVSIMNMVISFKKQSKTTKKESGEEETPRAEPPKARRGSIARVVESIKKGKSSAKKKEPTRPIETNNTARAADTTSDQAKAGSSSQQRAKKRNSLVKLANAIKFRPTSPSDNSNGTEMTATLDRSDKSKQAGAVAGQEPRPKATRPRRTNRRATTDAPASELVPRNLTSWLLLLPEAAEGNVSR